MGKMTRRIIIENVQPAVDHGRFPSRRAIGETMRVSADIFADGHDKLAAELLFRKLGDSQWRRLSMTLRHNDEWYAMIGMAETGGYEYTVEAWIDRFRTWLAGLSKKFEAGVDVRMELLEGAGLVAAAARRAGHQDGQWLAAKAEFLASDGTTPERVRIAENAELLRKMDLYPDKDTLMGYDKVLSVTVERERARFSAWYEMFPRSCSDEPGRHGTLRDCMARLPAVAGMGFDILYLPPIHPIGRTHRKGPNNTPVAGPGDPGSPWAIGAVEGGHRAVHPELGTLQDFRALVTAARDHDIEIAMDLAFQCSPDHPYVHEHPEWFRRRPDGSIQYAENPPKRYEDIFPFDFESEQSAALCDELLGVVRFWIDNGVRIFRVDNPHTKPLRFWEWLIGRVKQQDPEIIFLAEAFTRPKTMYRLAKSGFTQSYTYFTWRNLKWELEAYLTELTRTNVAEYFWPNFWPNTPDILPEYLQMGGRAAFVIRLVLAATLSSNYGVYGPAFELCENRAKEPFSEEYLDSEKYAIRVWEKDRPGHLRGLIKRLNQVRRQNPALQQTRNLRFHSIGSEEIICYSKHTDNPDNIVLVAVNLDPHHTHAGWLKLPLEDFGVSAAQSIQMHDLISDARYLWHPGGNYIELNPHVLPVHILRLRKRLRTEHDFDYFM